MNGSSLASLAMSDVSEDNGDSTCKKVRDSNCPTTGPTTGSTTGPTTGPTTSPTTTTTSGVKTGSSYTFYKHPLFILVVASFIGLVFHPKFFNIRLSLGRYEEPVPMNFVSNFYLWTRSNKQEAAKIVVGLPHELRSTHFRAKKTYVLIHGFTRTGLEMWIINMKNALLLKEDCNVISVDWQAGSVSVGYYVIQARVPQVGEDVARLITFLQENKINVNQIDVIGHSLGAHVAGFAGKILNGTLPRITGLDPAGLMYNSASDSGRLGPSDAQFVDVIHTHGCQSSIINQFTDCYGTYENLGHADFWPNGGGHQPPCDEQGDGSRRVREGSNCHHGMAYVYYTSSISFSKTSSNFRARQCDSWEHYSNGSCHCGLQGAQYMGFNANPKIHGVFYLNTSFVAPYGLLDPDCGSGEYSLFRIVGFVLCLFLSSIWCGDLALSAVGTEREKRIRNHIDSFSHEMSERFTARIFHKLSSEKIANCDN